MQVFSRSRFVVAEKIDDKTLRVVSNQVDTFHELRVTLEIDVPGRLITHAEAEFMRLPYSMCADVTGRVSKLAGVSLEGGVHHTLRDALGGPGGCLHLHDTTLEAIKAVFQAEAAFVPPEMAPGDFQEMIHKLYGGTCYAHSHSVEEKTAAMCYLPTLYAHWLAPGRPTQARGPGALSRGPGR